MASIGSTDLTKIFWSWQSDTLGKIGRHFVRDALNQAIDEIKANVDVAEAERPDVGNLHVDHDRKDVPGSPDLARTILDKIDQAAVFVADVTPVGASSDGRPLMNPNVAIELGYAMKVCGDQRILMVLNENYGGRESLPFDLRHKAGPIMFRLTPASTKAQIVAQGTELRRTLKGAVEEILALLAREAPTSSEVFPELQTRTDPSTFLLDNERLVRIPDMMHQDRHYDVIWRNGAQQFLRVIPQQRRNEWSALRLKQLLNPNRSDLRPFLAPYTTNWGGNQWGAVMFRWDSDDERHTARALTQISKYGEIWGIDGSTLQNEVQIIYLPESSWAEALRSYLRFQVEKLNLKPPFKIKAGMTGVLDFRLAMPTAPKGQYWPRTEAGQCAENSILYETVIDDVSGSPFALLLPFFEKVWETCQVPRPEYLPKE